MDENHEIEYVNHDVEPPLIHVAGQNNVGNNVPPMDQDLEQGAHVDANTFSNTADGIRITAKKHSQKLIIFACALLVIVLILIMVSNGGGASKPKQVESDPPAQHEPAAGGLTQQPEVFRSIAPEHSADSADSSLSPRASTAGPSTDAEGLTVSPSDHSNGPTQGSVSPSDHSDGPTAGSVAPTDSTGQPSHSSVAPSRSSKSPSDSPTKNYPHSQIIRSVFNYQCMSVGRINDSPMVLAYLTSCNNPSSSQLWTYDEETNTLRNGFNDECLMASSDGKYLWPNQCSEGLPSQKWRIDGGRIKNMYDGKCLQVKNDGNMIYMVKTGSCDNGEDQQWNGW